MAQISPFYTPVVVHLCITCVLGREGVVILFIDPTFFLQCITVMECITDYIIITLYRSLCYVTLIDRNCTLLNAPSFPSEWTVSRL